MLQSVALMPADVTLVPQLPEKVKVLSLNNSLIHYNDQAAMFNDIAQAMGKDAWWLKHTMLGKPLSTHWDEGDGLGADGTPSAKMLIRNEAWSHIILQEQSGLPRTNVETFAANVKKWVAYIREYCPNPNAIIIVPINWAYSGDWANFTDFNKMFFDNYMRVARETGVTICPVGVAYQQAFDDKGAEGLAPWFQDDRHPTQRATYLGACLEYATIFGEDPTTVTWHPATLTDAQAEQMRACAKNAWQTYKQTVDQITGCVHYELRLTDTDGLSVETLTADSYTADGVALTDGTLCMTERGTVTVQAAYGSQTYTATALCDTAVTQVVEIDVVDLEEGVYSQDFNSIGVVTRSTTDAKGMKYRSDLPFGWRIDRNLSGPRLVGSYFHAADTLMYLGGVSLASNAYNGTWNWGADDSEDRAVGGLTTGVDNGTRGINIMLAARNYTSESMVLEIAYDIEKYRSGNNSAGFTVQLYYSPDGVNWTSAGSNFESSWAADAATQGFAEVPAETRHVSAQLPVTVKAEQPVFLAWNISVSSGTNCAGAQGLALDNVTITAQPSTLGISLPSGEGTGVGSSALKHIRAGRVIIRHNGVDYTALGLPIE